MGSVKIHNGIGFSEASGAKYIDLSTVKASTEAAGDIIRQPLPQDFGTMPWSPWGNNNLKPLEYTLDIETCGILNAIIDGKARFAMGEGMIPAICHRDEKTGQKIIEKYVDDAEINDFLEMNNHLFHTFAWLKDGLGFANGVCRYGLNKKKSPTIVSFQRDDVTEFRYEKKDKKGKIQNIWMSAEWNKVGSPTDEKAFSTPLLSFSNPVLDLRKKVAAGGGQEYAITFKYPGWNKHYYPIPLWWAAKKWVEIAKGVPEMKAAIFENSMHVKYLVIIQETYWEKNFDDWHKYEDKQRDEARKKLYDDIDNFLVGSKNAYKSVFTTGYHDREGNSWTDIEIKPIDDTMKEGKLLPDSAAANSEISFAMLFNNAIIGGNQASGLYEQSQGGSNVRESVMLQVIIHEFERYNIKRIMDVPKYFNGWATRLPGLEFIIPTTMLTTLDTGSSSKPVVTGNTKPQEENGSY